MEFLFAQVVSGVVNFSMRAPKEYVEPKQFMPSQWKTKPKSVRRSRQQIAAHTRAVMLKAFGIPADRKIAPGEVITIEEKHGHPA